MVKEKNLVTKLIALLHFKQKSGVLNRYNSLISPLEFSTRKSTKHSKSVQELISILSPSKFKGDLKRFGDKGDGSYVLPINIVSPKYVPQCHPLGDCLLLKNRRSPTSKLSFGILFVCAHCL